MIRHQIQQLDNHELRTNCGGCNFALKTEVIMDGIHCGDWKYKCRPLSTVEAHDDLIGENRYVEFSIGDRVEVVSGPFQNRSGVIVNFWTASVLIIDDRELYFSVEEELLKHGRQKKTA